VPFSSPQPGPTSHKQHHGILLLVDDDTVLLEAMRRFFTATGWTVATAANALSGLEAFERDLPSVVVLDVNLPGISGMDALRVMLDRDPDAVVVMLTGHGDVELAVEAMRMGAENFLTKPVPFGQLDVAIGKAAEKAALRRLAKQQSQSRSTGGLAALSGAAGMGDLARQVELLAPGTAPLLLTGETGTGKGWLARLIHDISPRARAPFITINCAGLGAAFLDTELFGHERAASAEANDARQGMFEVADGGTIFLDEIGDLAPEVQPKLLTLLETQRFRRLGGTCEIEVDVRVVAATQKDLAAEVKAQRFRDDLYYRLAVLPLRIPPLRERGVDAIVQMATTLLRDIRLRLGRGPDRLSEEAMLALTQYPWPGNIRELRNILERGLMLAGDGPVVHTSHLPEEFSARATRQPARISGPLALDAVVNRHIARVLEQCGGNKRKAAAALGITRSTLYKRLGLNDLPESSGTTGK
jgi:DNA-binding NtrC family response regulator